MAEKIFSNDWFKADVVKNFEHAGLLLPKHPRILEVGCYEGQATNWMAENMHPEVIHVIDSFEGSIEHVKAQKSGLYERFRANMSQHLDILNIHKGYSHNEMCKLVPEFTGFFDFIYIDASHTSWDVLADATIAFNVLASTEAIIIFDDYNWVYDINADPLFSPKIGIDAFLSVYKNHCEVLISNYQLCIRKTVSQFDHAKLQPYASTDEKVA